MTTASSPSRAGTTTVIPLTAIRDLSIGHYPQVMSPVVRLHFISVTYEEGGQTKRLFCEPVPGWFGRRSHFNRFVAEWFDAIRAAITAATGRAPANTPANQLGTPSSSRALLLALLLPLVVGLVLVGMGLAVARVSPPAAPVAPDPPKLKVPEFKVPEPAQDARFPSAAQDPWQALRFGCQRMNPSANDRSASAFRTTHWTQVLAARGESTEAKQALRDLCEVYYSPVEAFVRRYRPGHDDARDLTHEFFAKLLEGNSLTGAERTRGRFRSYLLGAVKHFLSDRVDRSLAEKRGGGQSPQSLQASPSHDRSERREHTPLAVADPHGFPPDAFFDRQWALAIVETAMSILQAESQDHGKKQRFEVLRRWLIPSEDGALAAAAARSLDMTDGAFKVAVHRLRKRFRQLVKDQIASSVDGPEALQGELDYLIEALTASESDVRKGPIAAEQRLRASVTAAGTAKAVPAAFVFVRWRRGHAPACCFMHASTRRCISSGGTSSVWVASVQMCPKGSVTVPDLSP